MDGTSDEVSGDAVYFHIHLLRTPTLVKTLKKYIGITSFQPNTHDKKIQKQTY